MKDVNDLLRDKKIELTGTGVLVVLLFAVSAFLFLKLTSTEHQLTVQADTYKKNLTDLQQQMADVQSENDSITATLTDQQIANVALEREKRKKDRQINSLTKLTTTDPELLNKYSKVFFLSENYVPKVLVDIDQKYISNPSKSIKISGDIYPFLQNMLDDAESDGVTILIASGYRSFEEQKNLKDAYTVEYGAGTANNFSAEQGYSEHQLGTTLDFTTPVLKGALPGFDSTAQYKWLQDNAYKYGFVLSYPKGNSYYKYEPWHWRFVGKSLASDLHTDGKYFYELDQRDIDAYLIKIFD